MNYLKSIPVWYWLVLFIVAIVLAGVAGQVFKNSTFGGEYKRLESIIDSGDTALIQSTFNLSKESMDSKYYLTDKDYIIKRKFFMGEWSRAIYETLVVCIPIASFVAVSLIGCALPWFYRRSRV